MADDPSAAIGALIRDRASASTLIASARRTVSLQAAALDELLRALEQTGLGSDFERAVTTIQRARGHVVLSGIGKSGLVARKISATLASTGTPALFIHAAEAGHGDLGTITRDNVAVLLSWSGETSELSIIVSYCRRFAIPLIAISARPDSTLCAQADVALILPSVREACPNQLAPTCSTTMQMVIGDALAVALMQVRGFSHEDFKVFHPAGTLAAQLVKVGDVMSTGELIPRVAPESTLLDAIVEMSLKRFGITAVTDREGRLIGAFSDGDVRRTITRASLSSDVTDHMTLAPCFVTSGMMISEAVALMNGHNITQLFVCDDGRLTGIVHLHDLLRRGAM